MLSLPSPARLRPIDFAMQSLRRNSMNGEFLFIHSSTRRKLFGLWMHFKKWAIFGIDEIEATPKTCWKFIHIRKWKRWGATRTQTSLLLSGGKLDAEKIKLVGGMNGIFESVFHALVGMASTFIGWADRVDAGEGVAVCKLIFFVNRLTEKVHSSRIFFLYSYKKVQSATKTSSPTLVIAQRYTKKISFSAKAWNVWNNFQFVFIHYGASWRRRKTQANKYLKVN